MTRQARPGAPPRRVELGRAYRKLGQAARAAAELEAALRLEVEDINAHLSKARAAARAAPGAACLAGRPPPGRSARRRPRARVTVGSRRSRLAWLCMRRLPGHAALAACTPGGCRLRGLANPHATCMPSA